MVTVLRKIMTDELCIYFNWDGRAGKGALKDVEPFRNVLFGKILSNEF